MRKAKLLKSDWESTRYGVSKYPLLLAGDRLVGYAEGSIFALDIYTGKEVITVLDDDNPIGLPYGGKCSAPIHGNGGLYFMNENKLVALRLADGLPLPGWTLPTIANVTWMSGTTHPTDPYVGVIVTAQTSARGETSVSGYDMKDGRQLWGPIAKGRKSIGKIGLGTDSIFFVAGEEMTAVNTSFGDTRWHVQLGVDMSENPTVFDTLNQDIIPQVVSVPSVGERVVCAGSQLHYVDAKDGKQLWCSPLSAQQSQWLQPALDTGSGIMVAVSRGAAGSSGRVKSEVRCLDLFSGATKWTVSMDGDLGAPSIAGSAVYVHNRQENRLYAIDLVDPTKRTPFIVDKTAVSIPALIGNGTLFIPKDNGEIHAKSFAEQNAAYFNGSAQIDIVPDGGLFTFSENCLTMEAWVHSTEGGDIVAGYPLTPAPGSECFRFNLSKNGEVGFGILSPNHQNMDLVRSAPSKANDGFWHHVAVTWDKGIASLYLDGIALKSTSTILRNGTRLFTNDLPVQPNNVVRRDWIGNPRPPGLTLHGENALTIGAFRDGPAKKPINNFNGLLREVRIWDKALSVTTLQSRMKRVVGPLGDSTKAKEALLLGNWHLDGNMKSAKTRIPNDVYQHAFPGEPNGVGSRVTDLVLDDSAFPFLLDHVVESWPDIDHWSSRGKHPIENPAALSSNGVLCFGTSTALYGVEEDSGIRRWTVYTPEGASKPVSWKEDFYALTAKRELIKIDAASGGFETIHRLGAASGEIRISAPACDDRFVAAAGADGKIWVWERTLPKSSARTFSTAASPADLSLSEGVLSFITGVGPEHSLYTIDLTQPSAQPVHIKVQSDVFFAHHHSVFYIDESHNLVSRDRTGAIRHSPSISASITGEIIGMAASMDDDLVVAVTKTGVLYGLSCATLTQRWVANFPAPPRRFKARATLHKPERSPIIKNGIAYCSHANSVVAFDGQSGQYRSLFLAPHEVTTALAVNNDGTIYFGGAPETGRDRLDGALHSVVFGRTSTLRLGIDLHNALSTTPNHLVVRENNPRTALSQMDARQCCVEAWINTRHGGEVLSICPSSTQRYGLALSVGETGKIRYTSYHLQAAGGWEHVQAEMSAASSKAIDGMWHHIAVSCQKKPGNDGYDVRTYLDGVLQTATCGVSSVASPAAVVTGLTAYIGADAMKAGNAPANHYRGLIADVRVWDTYMTASEISDRMHVKLRGIEPSLAAYWNFAIGIHDESPTGHDAEFAIVSNDPSFWLSDLSFDQPTYPYLTTSAIITQMGKEAADGDAAVDTIYELTLTAYAADGSVLPNHVLDLWYVKHPDERDIPETITLQAPGELTPTVIHAVLPDHELLNRRAPDFDEKKLLKAKNSFTRNTNAKGQLVLTVITTLPAHGPSLDLHAAFMPTNQRFHVNVLNENQTLQIPTPPFLSAQSKLIQDYHYTPGNEVNETRSREVYRTILTAQDPDGTPRPRERFELWATETVEIEVKQVKYTINAQNSQTFRADEMGSLTIDVAAKELKMPDLSVWAGFMHRGERTTVSVDQDAQAKLSTVTGAEMSDKNRMVNWKKDGATTGSLLKDDYHTHSDKISASIRHLSSAAQPATHQTNMKASSSLLGSDVLLRASQKALLMQQREIPVRGDAVRLVRTQRHIMRTPPVTPEAVLKSFADAQDGPHDEITGVEIDFEFLSSNAHSNASGLGVRYLTAAHSRQYMLAAAGGVGALSLTDSHWKVGWQGGEIAANLSSNLGGWFDDAFDWVADAATSLVDEIKKIAIVVADTVMVAVTYATEVVCEAVNTVGDALRYVGEFLYKLAIMIIDVIKFMMFLFDWGAIKETHNILRALFENCASYATHQMHQLKDEIPKSLHSVMDAVLESLSGDSNDFVRTIEPEALKLLNAPRVQEESQQDISKEVSSIPSSMILSRSKDFVPSNLASILPDTGSNPGIDAIIDFLKSLGEAVPELINGNFAEAGDRVVKAFKVLFEQLMDAAIKTIDRVVQQLVDVLSSIFSKLKDTIEIPFVSKLYSWIFDSELTFLSLIALIMAIPVNLVYGVITGLTTGTLRHFNDDAKNLPNLFRIPVQGSDGLISEKTLYGDEFDVVPWGKPTDINMDAAYAVTRALYCMATYGTDMLFMSELLGARTPARPLAKIIKGVTGISSSCIMFVCCAPESLRIVRKTLGDRYNRSTDMIQAAQIAGFVAGLVGDTITLLTGATGIYKNIKGPTMDTPALSRSTVQDIDMHGGPNNSIVGDYDFDFNIDFDVDYEGIIDTLEGQILTVRVLVLLGITGYTLYTLRSSAEYFDSQLNKMSIAYLTRDLASTVPRLISPAYTAWGQQKLGWTKAGYSRLGLLRLGMNGGATIAHVVGAGYQYGRFK